MSGSSAIAIPTERPNWLFAGSLRSGQWAAAIMSLIQTARMDGHDPTLIEGRTDSEGD